MICQWVHDCDTNHRDCVIDLSQCILPARLLDVRPDNPRLVALDQAAQDAPTRTIYFALSHCWGKDGVPLKTTRENLGRFESSIPFKHLPRTFRDAVTITRKLNACYLWIDSLCIIQDDKTDWEREAAKMADIFRGAHLTLAASSAEDCHGGCFEPQPATPALRFDLPETTSKEFGGSIYIQGVFKEEMSHITVLDQSPIHNRGWIFQEMLLSRRVLHLTKGQIYWQCRSLLESEDQILSHTCEVDLSRLINAVRGPHYPYTKEQDLRLPRTLLPSFLPGSNLNTLAYQWWSSIREYSRRSLSFPNDFLPALSGVVALYERLMEDESVVGLWKKNLVVHLSWKLQFLNEWRAKAVDEQAPSWSWIKLVPFWDNPVDSSSTSRSINFPSYSYMPFGIDGFQVIWKADVRDIKVTWEGSSMVSKLNHAELKIASIPWPIKEIDDFMTSVMDPRYTDCRLRRSKHRNFFDLEKHHDLHKKAGLPVGAIEILLWIAFDQTGDRDGTYFRHCSMLIVPAGESQQPGVYRRIGIADGEWSCTRNDRAEAEKFILSRLPKINTVVRLI